MAATTRMQDQHMPTSQRGATKKNHSNLFNESSTAQSIRPCVSAFLEVENTQGTHRDDSKDGGEAD